MGDRWRVVGQDGTILDPLLHRRVTLRDYLPDEERAMEPLPMPAPSRKRKQAGVRGPWRTRIVHPTDPGGPSVAAGVR